MTTQLLQEVTACLWTEADLLDHCEYEDWLNLWDDEGLYIVPIDPKETDFHNTLNFAHDDRTMRRLRVERLTGGESVSVNPPPRTVRQISRVRVLSDDGRVVVARAAQFLSEFRKDVVRYNSADIEYHLVRAGEGFKLLRKIVRIINSEDALVTVGYIF
jgi:3-phenylpropionate/cinnamic acid dioxygenase small subunit